MKAKVLKRVLSAVLSLQMICAFIPNAALNVSAEELQMYLSENFTSENNKWTGKTENMEIVTDEEIPYMRYIASDTEQKVTRKVDSTIAGGSVYVAEFDVRFADENSGVVELYGGSQLGPTIIFDGEKIKTKIGNPSSYETMYQGASANQWYNVKFLANGTTSMVGYTKAAGTDEEAQATKSDKVIRNLKNTIFSQFNVTNKVNGESDIRSGAVDVRNMKVYKPAPTEVTIGVTDDISKVSIPAEGTTKTVNYLVAAASFNGVDLSSYEPLSKELVKFELYNSDDTESLQENLPTGITLNPATGVLTVSSEADAGEYNVRLLSYDGAVYDSKKITIAQAGSAASVSLVNPAEKLPIPNKGTVNTEFFAQCYDKAGSEAYGISLKWSLLNVDGTELNDSGISINESTGVISSTSSAAASSFKVKVALEDNPNVYEISEEIETYKMTASKIDIIGADMLQTASQVSETYTIKIFDQYGAEMPSEELSGWNAENMTDGITFENGVLTAAANSDSDVIIKATSGDITAEKYIIINSPTLASNMIAHTAHDEEFSVWQTTVDMTYDAGDIIYHSGARGSGGDNISGVTSSTSLLSSIRCMTLSAGRFSTSNRGAGLEFVNAPAYYDDSKDYVLDTDIFFDNLGMTTVSYLELYDTSNALIGRFNYSTLDINEKEWYHIAIVYDNGEYLVHIFDKDGGYVSTKTLTNQSTSTLPIKYLKYNAYTAGSGSQHTAVDILNLKYYESNKAMKVVTVMYTDDLGNPIPDATIKIGNLTSETTEAGLAGFDLPNGVYRASVYNGDTLIDSKQIYVTDTSSTLCTTLIKSSKLGTVYADYDEFENNLTVYNYTNDTFNKCVAIKAIYNADGSLYQAEYIPLPNIEKLSSFSISFNDVKSANQTTKLMFWDSMDTMKTVLPIIN